MPIVECRLWDGASINWDTHKAHTSRRCSQCRAVYPGDLMAEVNPETMRCRECEAKGEHNAAR